MNGSSRPHIDIPSLVAQSALVADWDQITLSVSFELQNNGAVAAGAVAWEMVLMPLMVPIIPPNAGPAAIEFPPGPETQLNQFLDRAEEPRGNPLRAGESRRATATGRLDKDLLRDPGSLWEDRSFVPLFYVAISYLAADNGKSYQTGRIFQVRARNPVKPDKTCDPVLDRLPILPNDLFIIPHPIVGVVERGG